MPTVLIEGCAVATLDAAGTEHADGHVVITDGRIAAVGPGPAPDVADAQRIDGRNCLLTPGFVNTHHHLYQWLTRGYAPDGTLFEWLTTLYPVWAHIDAESEYTAASAGLAALALSGCTTAVDHHYVFPASAGDLLASEIEAARRIGLRFHPARGAMNLGSSSGGLPPDSIVEDHDAILAACEAAVTTYHDARFDSMLRIAIAPCSPFTATRELMRDCADLARRLGVRLHKHLAETTDEEEFCLTSFGARPVDYIESLGWLGADVWLAHCVHVSAADIAKYAATGTGTAHCPSSNARLGSGIAPVPELLAAGAPVGLGVDGGASNEQGALAAELHQALLIARCRSGPRALTARDALYLATMAERAASAARPRSARWKRASSPTSRYGDSTASGTLTSRIPSAPWYSGRRPRSNCCSSAGGRSWRTTSCALRTSHNSPPPIARRRASSPNARRASTFDSPVGTTGVRPPDGGPPGLGSGLAQSPKREHDNVGG
jgi:cytosine/adenosine deaminase-related metal-dependent hydrolase